VIEILTTWNLIVLILIAIAAALLVGHASTKIFTRVIEKLFGIKKDTVSGDMLEKLFIYVGLGFIFIIIYSIVLSVFSFFNQIGVLLLLGLLLIVEFIFLNREKKDGARISDYTKILKGHLRSIARKPGQLFLVGLIVVAVVWYFYPAIQLATYPGGDDRGYLFVTKQFIDRGTALTAIDYPYAFPYTDQLLMAGFMTVASFFYDLLLTIGLPTTIPIIHLFLVLLYFSLTPISMYLFTKGLSGNKEFSIIVALASLFLWNSILMYWYWGGVGEAMGYFLVPLLALVDYRLNENLMSNRSPLGLRTFTGTLIIKSVMLVIALYVHVYSLFLFVFFVIVVTPLRTIRNHQGKRRSFREKAKMYLILVLPYLVLSLGVIIVFTGVNALLQLTGSKNATIQRLYDFLISSPQDILNFSSQVQWTAPYLVFLNGKGLDYALSQLTSILAAYDGEWILTYILLFAFCIVLFWALRNREESFHTEGKEAVGLSNLVALAGVAFFLFIQNSPFGWYYLSYPLAKSVLAVRIYYELNVFLIFVEALPIYLVYAYAKKRIMRLDTTSNTRPRRRMRQRSAKHANLKKIGAVAITIIFTASVTLPFVDNVWGVYANQRIMSPVTQDDLDAFRWIDMNTPRNATFFVSLYDAGGYIYVYTGRTVLPPLAMRAWSITDQSWAELDSAMNMIIFGNITYQLIQIFKRYNVSYVYVGEKIQYVNSILNLTALIRSPYFEVAFQQGGAYLFKINETAM
jgi:hypothetical protein